MTKDEIGLVMFLVLIGAIITILITHSVLVWRDSPQVYIEFYDED